MAAIPILEGLSLSKQIINFFKTKGVYYGIVEKQKNDSENSILVEIINCEKEAITNVIMEVTLNTKITGGPYFKRDESFLKSDCLEDKFSRIIAIKLNPRQLVAFSFDCEKCNDFKNLTTVKITYAEGKKVESINKQVAENDEIIQTPLLIGYKTTYEEIKANILS